MSHLHAILEILKIPPNSRSGFDIQRLQELTSSIEFFRQMTEDENSGELHLNCCRLMGIETYSEGEIVFAHGSMGDTFYILIHGSVSVKIPSKPIDPCANTISPSL